MLLLLRWMRRESCVDAHDGFTEVLKLALCLYARSLAESEQSCTAIVFLGLSFTESPDFSAMGSIRPTVCGTRSFATIWKPRVEKSAVRVFDAQKSSTDFVSAGSYGFHCIDV